MSLIQITPKGFYCKEGNFYIDPSSKVENALVTHAHTDHARKGSDNYFCAQQLEKILQHRIGPKAKINAIPYRKQLNFNKVLVSFHPAGHMLGSAQIRVEHNNEVWVISGDYKRQDDPTCEPFELVKCDVFITEATFALPKYVWRPSNEIIKEIIAWYNENKNKNITSVLLCYSLGKSQRILSELASYIKDPVYVHDTIAQYISLYKEQGVKLARTKPLNTAPQGALAICPPNAKYLDIENYTTAYVSGWMHDYHISTAKGFALSDHADWPALIQTIEETGARKVLITHGYAGALIQHLKNKGIEASEIKTIPKERPRKGQLTLKRFLP